MIAQPPRDPWRTVWQIVTGDLLLVALLLAVAAGLTLTAWLPQMPAADPVAHAQWLSEAQARFGTATQTMQALGLFTVTYSLGFRALLALLAGCLLLRLIEGGGRLWRSREMAEPRGEWRGPVDVRLRDVLDDLRRRHYRVLREPLLVQADHWPWADLFPLLAYAGALLLLVGLLITHLWGWRVEGLIVRSGERITLPGTGKWVTLDEDGRQVTHSPGIVTFVEGRGPGVRASANDGAEKPLSLQLPEADPATQLTLALTEDQYFAIPEVSMVVRLAPQSDSASTPVRVQFYRSPPGRFITEMVTEKGGSAELTVDEVTLRLTRAPYTRLTATFNPGLWLTAAGLVLLIAGLLGSVAWPVRCFWLREEAGGIEGAGDLPLVLARGEEA